MDIIEPQDSKPQAPASAQPTTFHPKARVSATQQMLRLIDHASWTFWCTPGGDPYATVLVHDVSPPHELTLTKHSENWRIDSDQFHDHLLSLYYDSCGDGYLLGTDDIARVLARLKVKARRGQRHAVHRRCVFDVTTNSIYIDMGNENWDSIVVTQDGPTRVRDMPVKFVRSDQIRALADPVTDKFTLQQCMRELVNVREPDDLILVIGFMLYALSGKGSYPVLCLYGGTGTGKSATCETIKRLIDPGDPDTKGLPFKDEEQLMVIAENNHCLAFDNISTIAPWQSDAFCRLSTGAGMGIRQHYKHKEEVIYRACRPIILTGIEQFVQRNDLADRAITVDLAQFDGSNDRKRLGEAEYKRRVELLAGRVLGKLLEGLSCGLQRLNQIRIVNWPRMGEFSRFVTAAEPGLGLEPGTFLRIYQQNISRNSSVAVESSSVVPLIVELVQLQGGAWQGSATELWTRLNAMLADRYMRPGPDWPKQPNMLSGQLKRLGPNLAGVGVFVTMDRTNKGSWVSLRLV